MKFVRRKSADAPAAAPSPRHPRAQGARKAGATPSPRGQRFILIVGDEGGILVFMQGKKVQRRLFAPSPQPDHTAAVTELMRNHPKVPLYILADVLDQQYVRQTFPPVSSFSVAGLVKRRLDRDFQAEDMKGSLPLGRDKAGRKEWNYLLIALANTPLMQQWLELIVELPNEFRGVYLTPVEGQSYIPMLKKYLPQAGPSAPWQLLVSHNKISGFRQIVLKEGKLVFTRVTQAIDDAVPAVIAGNIEQEIINTLEYLRRVGFEENDSLEIIAITAQEVKEALDLKRFNTASAATYTPYEVAEALKLEQAALSADRFGDVIMACSFALARKPVLRFQTAYAKQLAQFYTIRRSVFAFAALVCLYMTFLAISNVISALSDRAEASDLEAKRKPVIAQLDNVKRSISKLDIDIAKKSAIVAAYDMFIKQGRDPNQFVADLAPNLTDEQRVSTITWAPKSGDNTATKDDIEIKIEMTFEGKYADVDALAKSVEAFIANLRTKMPGYTIATGAFGWLGGGGGQSLEISFDKEAGGLREGMNKIELFFTPKKKDTNAASKAPSPAAGAMP